MGLIEAGRKLSERRRSAVIKAPPWLRVAVRALAVAVTLVAAVELAIAASLGLDHPEIVRALAADPANVVMGVELAFKALAAGVLASMGVPVEWSATLATTRSGEVSLLSGGWPTAAIVLLGPAALTVWMGHRSAVRGSSDLRYAVATGLAFAAGCAVLVIVANGEVGVDAFLRAGLAIDAIPAVLVAVAWGVGGCILGRSLARHELPRLRVAGMGRGRRLAALCAALCALAFIVTPSGGAPSGRPLGGATAVLTGAPSRAAASPTQSPRVGQREKAPVVTRSLAPGALERLREDATDLQLIRDRENEPVSFATMRLPVTAAGVDRSDSRGDRSRAVLDRYGAAFGVDDPSSELAVDASRTRRDDLGMERVSFEQVYRGVPVYRTRLSVHFDRSGANVVAITSDVAAIAIDDMEPSITPEAAIAAARRALPAGMPTERPRLVVYPGATSTGSPTGDLSWVVSLDAGAARSARYVVDAQEGTIIDVIDRPERGLHRSIFDARNTRGLGLEQHRRRTEGQGPRGDRDVDQAYDFAGATYGVFRSGLGRDSIDNRGLGLRLTTHFGDEPDAFYSGVSVQMGFSDGFAEKDVVAHEYTHGVTQFTADLRYGRGQSGALNEGFSDIYGVAVDGDDWLIGDTLPRSFLGDKRALRNMANPQDPSVKEGSGQRAHMSQFSCADPHRNSGIPNKAYYTIATAIGRPKAERIFYRALSTYLGRSSGFAVALSATKAAAGDLYGSAEVAAVTNGWGAVGVTAQTTNPDCDRGFLTCGVLAALSGPETQGFAEGEPTTQEGEQPTEEVADAIYAVRDTVMEEEPAGQHYEQVWEANTVRVAELLIQEPELRQEAATLLEDLASPMASLAEGDGEEATMTPQLTAEMTGFLEDLAVADATGGGGELGAVIEQELERVDLPELQGLTFDEVLIELNEDVTGTSPAAPEG